MFSVYLFPLWRLREYIYIYFVLLSSSIGSMNYYPHCLGLGHETMECASFCILMNLWYVWIASWDIHVLVIFAPNLALCHWHADYYHARYPTDDWHLAYMFSLVYFSVEGSLVGVFPILLAQGEIPAACPSRWLPTSRKNKIRTGGDSALYLIQARGHLNWRMSLPALLGGNLGCWIVLISNSVLQFMGVF